MRIKVRAGTPQELEQKSYGSAGPAKKYLRGKIMKRQEWAVRFNQDLAVRLVGIREEIDGLDLTKLPVGDVRRWAATDEYTNVTFQFELEKEYG